MRAIAKTLVAAPGIVLSALPVGGCPACWPVYAGILSALGLSVLLSPPYLLPLTVIFLLITLTVLWRSARKNMKYAPLLFGLAGAALILLGKFAFTSGRAAYSGIALLVFGSVWNAWPRRLTAHCPKCVPSSTRLIQLNAKGKAL